MSSALALFEPRTRLTQRGNLLAEGSRILPANHQSQWAKPGMIEDHADRAGLLVDNDVRQANGSEGGRIDDLSQRRAEPVSRLSTAKLGEKDGEFPDRISRVRRVKLHKDLLLVVEADHEQSPAIPFANDVEAGHVESPVSVAPVYETCRRFTTAHCAAQHPFTLRLSRVERHAWLHGVLAAAVLAGFAIVAALWIDRVFS